MLTLRSLGSDERAAMRMHLLALSTPDRCDRFLAAVHDNYLDRYVESIAFSRDLLIGAFDAAPDAASEGASDEAVIGTAPGAALVGLVHAGVQLERQEPSEWNLAGGPSAEVGVSVLVSHRRLGLGRRLLCAVIDAAQARGIARLEVLFRSSNRSMAALTRSLGGHIEHRGAESHSVFEL